MSQPYDRVYNFSAGPCTLPVEVLEEARDGLLNWQGKGMSVMEMSHRSKTYMDIQAQAGEDLRALMGVPENYKILFLQGGASTQNTMIPMNLLREDEVADYIVTGEWGKKSYEAAQCVGCSNLIYDGKPNNYSEVPDLGKLNYSPNASYVHWVSNETIQGVEFQGDLQVPGTSVCDVSSNILSRPMNVSNYAMLYAGAQKNMGPAGVTVVIIRDDLLERTPPNFHPMLDYRLHAKNDSIYNTPPCWSIYMCGLVYKWLLKNGGLTWIHPKNVAKAKVLYDAIDASGGFYKGHADKNCRSIMNITFTMPTEEITEKFVKESATHKLDGLKGHRSVGGVRASIYNAFPLEGCETMASFMKEFAAKNG